MLLTFFFTKEQLRVSGSTHYPKNTLNITQALYITQVQNNICVMSSDLLISKYRLYDFLTTRGRNAILEWVKDERLTPRDRAMLNQKLTRLSQLDYELAVSTKLLSGPIYKSIYKLTIHGDRMLRPMLCRGPIDNDTEYTLLLGAIEVGGKLPKGSMEEADERRSIVIDDPERRVPHERIP